MARFKQESTIEICRPWGVFRDVLAFDKVAHTPWPSPFPNPTIVQNTGVVAPLFPIVTGPAAQFPDRDSDNISSSV